MCVGSYFLWSDHEFENMYVCGVWPSVSSSPQYPVLSKFATAVVTLGLYVYLCTLYNLDMLLGKFRYICLGSRCSPSLFLLLSIPFPFHPLVSSLFLPLFSLLLSFRLPLLSSLLSLIFFVLPPLSQPSRTQQLTSLPSMASSSQLCKDPPSLLLHLVSCG